MCDGSVNARFLTHLYIMGFQFNPSGGSYTLAASALRNGGGSNLADTDEAAVIGHFDTTLASVSTGPTSVTSGPRMLLGDFGSQVKYVKVGIVITIITDISTNPPTSGAFEYAGVYMDYALYNVAQPVSWAPSAQPPAAQPGSRTAGEQNYNFFPLLNNKYSIIGLSSFAITTLPADVTVVNYELSFPDIATVLLQTDDVNEL